MQAMYPACASADGCSISKSKPSMSIWYSAEVEKLLELRSKGRIPPAAFHSGVSGP